MDTRGHAVDPELTFHRSPSPRILPHQD